MRGRLRSHISSVLWLRLGTWTTLRSRRPRHVTIGTGHRDEAKPAPSSTSRRRLPEHTDRDRFAGMDLSLSDEQLALRELARDFIDAEVTPYAAEWDRAEAVDRSIVGKLAKVGFLGMTVPETYG